MGHHHEQEIPTLGLLGSEFPSCQVPFLWNPVLPCATHISIAFMCKKNATIFVRWRHQFHVDCWWSPCWRLWSFALLRQASWRRAASEDWAARPEHGHSLSPRIGREEILGNPHFEVGTITGLVVWNIWNMFFHSVGNFMIPTYPNWLSLHHLFSPYYIYIYIYYHIYIYTLGISSSQLTNSLHHFSEGLGENPPDHHRAEASIGAMGRVPEILLRCRACWHHPHLQNPWMVVKQCHKPSPISPCL